MQTPVQDKACGPEIVEYIALDSLLAGYDPIPLLKAHYSITSCDEEGEVSGLIMKKLDERLGLQEDDRCSIETIVVESVQNIMQHCCSGGTIQIYASQDKSSALGAFELNDETQFGLPGHDLYKKILIDSCRKANCAEYDQDISDLMADDTDEMPNTLEGFYLGTMMIMRTKHLTRAGIVDIDRKAFFFFEYRLPEK